MKVPSGRVVVVFVSLARILGEGSTFHSLSVLFFCFLLFSFSGEQLMDTSSTFLGQDQSTVAQ